MSQRSPIAAARRSTELGLVLMAAVITAAAYTLASLGKNAEIPPIIVPFLVALLALLVVAHLANRLLATGADGTLLPLAALLNGIGYVMIARLSDRLAGLQTTWTFIAIVAYVATLLFVQRAGDLARYKWTFLFLGAGLLMLPLVPGVGASFGGARIWVSVGPINFQPGEFAKILLALFFAGYLAERRELIAAGTWKVGPFHLPEPRHLLPIVLAWGFAVVVMVGREGPRLVAAVLHPVRRDDVGGHRAGRVPGRSASCCSPARRSSRGRCSPTCRPGWRSGATRGRTTRARATRSSRSMFALANGGVSGTGLGLGSPTKIPEVKNDFIFAAIGEELGLLGATAVLIAFLLLIGAGLRIAMRTERPFEKLLATGLTTIIGDAGVHHHRRRHPGRAADRHHPAVRQLRRLEPAGQLHAPRPAGADQRRRRPPAR